MKSIKVILFGKRLKDIYPYATRFQVLKYRIRQFIRKCLITLIGFAIVYSAFLIGQFSRPIHIKAEQIDTLTLKVASLKDELLNQLKACESGSSNPVIVFDTNRKASIGSYQFQIDTVKHYSKTLNNQSLTTKEAVLLALDDDKARTLASQIIFTTDKGLNNWYNCTKKHGLDTQLSVINKLK